MAECDSAYPDAWAYTFVGIIDEADAGRLYRLHVDIRFAYEIDGIERWVRDAYVKKARKARGVRADG